MAMIRRGLIPGFRLIAEGGEEPLFLPRLLVLALRLCQERRGLCQEPVVGDEADNIADLGLLFQIAIEGGHGKTGIGPKEDQGLGIGLPQLLDQPLEHRQRPVGGVGVAGAQHRGQGKAVPAVKDEERMIHVLFVIAVEEAELLLAVGGVIGGVHVDDDDLPGAGMGLEVQLQQHIGEAAQVLGGGPVLKPGESGL